MTVCRIGVRGGAVALAISMVTAVTVAGGRSVFAWAQEPQQEQAQQPVFRSAARYVRVDVYATDDQGRPIRDLTAEDFDVLEDGERQIVDAFELVTIESDVEALRLDPNSQAEGDVLARDPRARVFVIVLDTKHVSLSGSARMRRPLANMLDRLIGPRDVFGVSTPQMNPAHMLFGRKTITAADMLDRHWTWGTEDRTAPDAVQTFFEGCYGLENSSPLTRELVARARERETLEYLSGLVSRLGALREEKKSILVVTQGWMQFGRNDGAADRLATPMPGIYSGGGRITRTNPRAGPGQSDPSVCAQQATRLLTLDNGRDFRELYEMAQRANVSFYPVDPRGLAPFDDIAQARNRRGSLHEIAINTDGEALMHGNDIERQLRTLTDRLGTYYLLGYYSSNTTFDGKFRKIDVKVKRPGVKFTARRGYYAPDQKEIDRIEAERAAAAAPVPPEVIALREALARLDGVRHDRDLYLQVARAGAMLVVNAELGVNARSAAEWADGGELQVAAAADGEVPAATQATLGPRRAGATLRIAANGQGDVRVEGHARAAGRGALSAADALITVPAPGPSVLIGDTLSYRGLARALQPAADTRYRRTERVTLEAVLADDAEAGEGRLLDRLGQPLAVPVSVRVRTDEHGVRWLVSEVVLAPLTEGDYIVEMNVTRGDAAARKLFGIRVVR